MSRRRWIVLLSAAVMLTAAPAKAWCDAQCAHATAAMAEAGEHAHCMTAANGPGLSMSAVDLTDCPTQDTARPASWARELSRESFAAAASAPAAHAAPWHLGTLGHPGTPGTLGTLAPKVPLPLAPLSASSVLRV